MVFALVTLFGCLGYVWDCFVVLVSFVDYGVLVWDGMCCGSVSLCDLVFVYIIGLLFVC